MKKSLKYLIALGLCGVGVASVSTLASCQGDPNITGTMDVVVTAETLKVTCSIEDPDSVINDSSVYVKVEEYDNNDTEDDTDDDETTLVSTLQFDELPGTEDTTTTVDGSETTVTTAVSQTKIASDLKSEQDYLLTFYCTYGSGKVFTFTSEHYTTNSVGKTEDNPIEISTPEDLYSMDDDSDAYYKLVSDIDLTDWDDDQYGTSIFSTTSTAFKGHLDGDGHKITGFEQTTSATYTGIFGYIEEGATISNVVLESPKLSFSRGNSTYCGAFASYNLGTITNCTVTGAELTIKTTSTSTTTTPYIGGFVGYNGGSIYDSSFEGTITNEYKGRLILGGFVGFDEGTKISNCKASAEITSTCNSTSSSQEVISFSIGGFVGRADGSIADSISEGSLTVTFSFNSENDDINDTIASQLGGFAGLYNSGRIKGCVANEDITFTSSQSFVINIGLFAGSVSTGLKVGAFTNNIYYGTDNTVTLTLLDDDGNYNYDRTITNDDGTETTETTDRIHNFGFINSLDTSFIEEFNTALNFAVIGTPTVTCDAEEVIVAYKTGTSDYTTLTLADTILEYISNLIA